MVPRGLVVVAALVVTCILAGATAASRNAAPTGRIVFEESSTPCPSGHCRTHITVMNADGSGRKMLTTNRYSDDETPMWSPNGRLIVFSHAAKNPRDAGLELMKANGTGVRLLVNARPTIGRLSVSQNYFSTLSWSANGKSALYMRAFSKQKCQTCRSVTRYGLMAVNVSGRPRPHRLFLLPGGAHRLTIWSEPSESPDGHWIALEKEFFTNDGSSVFEIWLVHPNGTRLHRLLRPVNSVSAFAFSPDSKRLAYVGFFPQWQSGCAQEDNETDMFETIWVISVGGGMPKPMWNMQCYSSPAPTDFLFDQVNTISWSPDGRQIVYPTTDWAPANQYTPPNEVKLALVLHAVDVNSGAITGIPNSRQSSDNCHAGGGSASSPCLLVDPDWTR